MRIINVDADKRLHDTECLILLGANVNAHEHTHLGHGLLNERVWMSKCHFHGFNTEDNNGLTSVPISAVLYDCAKLHSLARLLARIPIWLKLASKRTAPNERTESTMQST